MKKFLQILILCLVLAGVAWAAQRMFKKSAQLPSYNNMTITSVWPEGQIIPDLYGCKGKNINPPLTFSGVPTFTKSLVLIVDDPDSPSGVWAHWLVWNILPTIKVVQQNSVPMGAIEGVTSFGQKQYGGPCPGSGTHHYQFKLFALDTMLNLRPTSQQPVLAKAMTGHILAQAQLIGLYSH